MCSMNRVIKLLLFSDIFLVTGFGLIEPVFAIYVSDKLTGGSVFAVGLASTIYFVTKSLVELPFSRYVDTHNRRKFWLLLGTMCTAAVPLIYVFATRVEHIYLAQILYGIGSGLAFPTWLGLWSTSLDTHHESYEWSIYQAMTGFGAGAAAAVGSALVELVGFQFTFIIVGLISTLGCAILLILPEGSFKKLALRTPRRLPHHKRSLFR